MTVFRNALRSVADINAMLVQVAWQQLVVKAGMTGKKKPGRCLDAWQLTLESKCVESNMTVFDGLNIECVKYGAILEI